MFTVLKKKASINPTLDFRFGADIFDFAASYRVFNKPITNGLSKDYNFRRPEIIHSTQRHTRHRYDKRVTTEVSPRTNTQQCSETSQDTESCQAEGSVLHRFPATHLHVTTLLPLTLELLKMLPWDQKTVSLRINLFSFTHLTKRQLWVEAEI